MLVCYARSGVMTQYQVLLLLQTHDALPVISGIEDRPGYYILTGLSGHGFGMGPGAGLLMSELITRGKARVDLSPFRHSRFGDGTKMEPFAPF